jgi:hypothetical protein
MNKLVATWHQPADVDLGDEADVCELLARVHERLAAIPELGAALQFVDAALDEVLAWFDGGVVSLPVRG